MGLLLFTLWRKLSPSSLPNGDFRRFSGSIASYANVSFFRAHTMQLLILTPDFAAQIEKLEQENEEEEALIWHS